MTSEKYGFAFDSGSLAPIIDEDASVTPPTVSYRPSDSLAEEASREMNKMKSILGKLQSGTATREEKAELKRLNAKMIKMREEIAKSITTDPELENLKSESKKNATDLITIYKEKQAQSIIRTVCAAESVDLAFIIDCTESMGTYIEGVKDSIKSIVHQIKSTNGTLQLRLAVVAYRDLSEDGDELRNEVMDFTSSVSEFEDYVGKLEAVGGDDAPEDMAGGIQLANQLSWSYPTRVTFLIADCPCHGTEFHTYDDIYPSGTPGISIVNELQKLLKCFQPNNGTMSVYFGKITEHTDSMLARLKSEYEIELEVVPINDVDKLTTSITTSVRRSIFKTITVAGNKKQIASFAPPANAKTLIEALTYGGNSRSTQLKRFNLVNRTPSDNEWKLCPALLVEVYRNKDITSMEDLKLPLPFGRLILNKLLRRASPGRLTEPEHYTMYMRRAANPFAQGEIRIAFHGQLACKIEGLHRSKNSMVMKSFKHVGDGIHDRDQYVKQMEVSNIARFLAEQYNSSSDRPPHCAKVTFLPVCVVEEQGNTREKLGERRFCVEPPLPNGKFEKYSNNTGYWAEDILDESLLRFSAWTYKATGGYLMVADLQGVKCTNKNKFYLTDPGILCKDILRFGNTNLGPKFLTRCIDSTHSHLKEKGWS